MKSKNVFFFLFFATVLLGGFSSCSDDDDNSDDSSVIVGTWTLKSLDYDVKSNNDDFSTELGEYISDFIRDAPIDTQVKIGADGVFSIDDPRGRGTYSNAYSYTNNMLSVAFDGYFLLKVNTEINGNTMSLSLNMLDGINLVYASNDRDFVTNLKEDIIDYMDGTGLSPEDITISKATITATFTRQ